MDHKDILFSFFFRFVATLVFFFACKKTIYIKTWWFSKYQSLAISVWVMVVAKLHRFQILTQRFSRTFFYIDTKNLWSSNGFGLRCFFCSSRPPRWFGRKIVVALRSFAGNIVVNLIFLVWKAPFVQSTVIWRSQVQSGRRGHGILRL